MKEHVFVKQNKEKWAKYEREVSTASQRTTQSMSEIYQDLTADLAYAQSQYPNSRVADYLNNLTSAAHDYLYTPKGFTIRTLVEFFTKSIPNTMAESQRELLLAFVIFTSFVVAGVILAVQDIQNVIDTLGPYYVDMTLRNIENGVPTDVYGHSESSTDFIWITLNNLRVDLITYGYGLIPILGPGYIMKVNGVMLGEFQTLFFLKGVGLQSMTAIWIHGTIEISTIIIGSAASLTLGMGWVFPGNFSRKEALKRSGKKSVKILLSILPLTVIAGFLESFATRHTEWPLAVKLFIIFGSLVFILFYYVYYPNKIRKERGL